MVVHTVVHNIRSVVGRSPRTYERVRCGILLTNNIGLFESMRFSVGYSGSRVLLCTEDFGSGKTVTKQRYVCQPGNVATNIMMSFFIYYLFYFLVCTQGCNCACYNECCYVRLFCKTLFCYCYLYTVFSLKVDETADKKSGIKLNKYLKQYATMVSLIIYPLSNVLLSHVVLNRLRILLLVVALYRRPTCIYKRYMNWA